MFRRLSAISLALASSLVVACGHQVTPNPVNAFGDLSGFMQVKFQTSGPIDFTNFTYVIAVDMCGNGVPYPNAYASGSYASYTYAFLVGGGTLGTAQPDLLEFYLNPSSSGALTEVPLGTLNSSTAQFEYPYNGQNTEFEFTFRRSLLNNPLNLNPACPGESATPTPTASPTATPTGSAGPTPTPVSTGAATATPSASPSPSPSPTNADLSTGVSVPPYLTTWTFNMMTFPAGSHQPAVDSLGLGGGQDVSYSGLQVYTPTQGEYTYNRPPPYTIPSNPSSYITYVEVDTYP
jgi:hypothetical protein